MEENFVVWCRAVSVVLNKFLLRQKVAVEPNPRVCGVDDYCGVPEESGESMFVCSR